MLTSFPKVGILYITHAAPNWERDMDRCLPTLEKITYPKDRVELICIESASKLGPVKPWFDEHWMPKSGKELPHITYLYHYDTLMGFARNNNVMFEKARELGCEYVYLLNKDTEVDPNFLTAAVERAERDSKIAYVQSLLLLGDDRDRVNTVGNALHYLGIGYGLGYRWTRRQAEEFFLQEHLKNSDLEIGYASGAGMLGRVSLIQQFGLFDENFFLYHEDTDASLQAKVRGYKVVIEPASIVYHYYEFAKNKMNFYWMERNRYVLLWSYYEWQTLILLSPMLLIFELAELGFSIMSGWADMKWKMYKDWFSRSYWKWIVARRRFIQRSRTVSDCVFLSGVVSIIDFQETAVRNKILDFIGNPLMRWYWRGIKTILPNK